MKLPLANAGLRVQSPADAGQLPGLCGPGPCLLPLVPDPPTFLGDTMIVSRGPGVLGSRWAGNWYLYFSVGLRKNLTFDPVTKSPLFSVGADYLLAYLRPCSRPS